MRGEFCVSYFINLNLLLKKMFCKRKREKRKLSSLRLCWRQKGNGINKIWGLLEAIVYAVVFLHLSTSMTTAASFAFAFARILLQNEDLVWFLNRAEVIQASLIYNVIRILLKAD